MIAVDTYENAETSVRKISAQVGVNKNIVGIIIHQQLLSKCHIQKVQALTNPDVKEDQLSADSFSACAPSTKILT